jgi:MHS family proline/betaine transporter-like MFS transporter
MMQGLSVGGQLAGSYVLSIEQSSSRSRGFRGSVCDASSVGGFLLASLVTSTVRWSFSPEQVDAWGWRLPFLFSLLLAPLLYHVVSHTEESKFWEERNEQKQTEEEIREAEGDTKPAIMDLMSSPFRRRQLAGMVGILSATTSTFYILFLWTPVYLSELRGFMSQTHADSMNFMIVGIYILFLLTCGKLSDNFQHRMDLMRIGLPGIIAACPVMFAMFETDTWWGFFLGQLLLAGCLSMINGGLAAFEVEMWMADPTLSFTGVAVGHNLAATLFGGTMPLMATFLYYKSQELVIEEEGQEDFLHTLLPRMLPGFYISTLGLLSLICVSCVVKHPHDVRTGAPQLRAAVEAENRKFKAALDAKKKRRKNMEDQLHTTDGGEYLPPQIT